MGDPRNLAALDGLSEEGVEVAEGTDGSQELWHQVRVAATRTEKKTNILLTLTHKQLSLMLHANRYL